MTPGKRRHAHSFEINSYKGKAHPSSLLGPWHQCDNFLPPGAYQRRHLLQNLIPLAHASAPEELINALTFFGASIQLLPQLMVLTQELFLEIARNCN